MPDPISLPSNVYLYSKTRTTLLFVTLHLWLPTSLIGETYGRHSPYQLTGSDMYGTVPSANTHMANPKLLKYISLASWLPAFSHTKLGVTLCAPVCLCPFYRQICPLIGAHKVFFDLSLPLVLLILMRHSGLLCSALPKKQSPLGESLIYNEP